MNIKNTEPKAFFLSPDGKVYPDNLICIGIMPAQLDGKPCPYSQNGQFPGIKPLNSEDSNYTIDKGKPGDLCPICAKQQFAHLGHWQGYRNQNFPEELLLLRLFKCRMWLWLVVPGLHDHDATQLLPSQP